MAIVRSAAVGRMRKVAKSEVTVVKVLRVVIRVLATWVMVLLNQAVMVRAVSLWCLGRMDSSKSSRVVRGFGRGCGM